MLLCLLWCYKITTVYTQCTVHVHVCAEDGIRLSGVICTIIFIIINMLAYVEHVDHRLNCLKFVNSLQVEVIIAALVCVEVHGRGLAPALLLLHHASRD